MHRMIVISVVLAALLASLLGCESGYSEHNKQAASSISLRKEWIPASSASVANPELALDGNMGTAAKSGSSQTDAWVELDLGEVCLFNEVIIEHGLAEEGFAGRVSIYTSIDGENYTYRFTGPGNRRVSIFALVTPVLAKYVRLEVSQPGPHMWSLAEVYLR